MKTNMIPRHTFTAALAGLLAMAAAQAEENELTRNFAAKPGGKLEMRVDRGSIQVRPSAGDSVDIKVIRELKNGSAKDLDRMLEQHQIEMEQSGDLIKITAEGNRNLLGWAKNKFRNLRVEYIITVPSKFNLDLHTSGGNVRVSDLEGEIEAHTAGGSMDFGQIKGPVKARTAGGNVSLRKAEGRADLRTSGGSLNIGELRGDLVARTSGGNISMERIEGSVDAETSGGSILAKEVRGAVLARSSGGNVSAVLNGQPVGNSELKTSGGSVSVTLAEPVALDVSARTSGGRIHSDFPGDMNKQRTKLEAKINGGGPGLVLETAGGNVDIRRK